MIYTWGDSFARELRGTLARSSRTTRAGKGHMRGSANSLRLAVCDVMTVEGNSRPNRRAELLGDTYRIDARLRQAKKCATKRKSAQAGDLGGSVGVPWGSQVGAADERRGYRYLVLLAKRRQAVVLAAFRRQDEEVEKRGAAMINAPPRSIGCWKRISGRGSIIH